MCNAQTTVNIKLRLCSGNEFLGIVFKDFFDHGTESENVSPGALVELYDIENISID